MVNQLIVIYKSNISAIIKKLYLFDCDVKLTLNLQFWQVDMSDGGG